VVGHARDMIFGLGEGGEAGWMRSWTKGIWQVSPRKARGGDSSGAGPPLSDDPTRDLDINPPPAEGNVVDTAATTAQLRPNSCLFQNRF